MRFSDVAVQRMLDALDESASLGAKFASLHTAYSSTGAFELSGGSPVYARQAATWSAAVGRSKATTGSMVFAVPLGTTVRWIGFWVVGAGGVAATDFLGMVPNGGAVTQPFAAGAAGVASNTLDAPSHGLLAGQSVVVWAANTAEPLPSPLVEGTVYWVIATGLTTDALQLSATAGGSAIDITAAGAGVLQRLVEESFGAQGTLTVTSATMTLD